MDAQWLKLLPTALRRRVSGRHALQAIIGNSGWLFFDKALRAAIGLSVGIWMARYLGPEQFGQLSYAMAFVALFSVFATLGLDGIVVRELVKNGDAKESILGSAFVLKLIGGFAGFVLVQLAIQLFHPADTLAHWLIGIIALGMIFQAFDVVDFWFQSQVQSRLVVAVRSAVFATLSLAKVILILGHASLVAFAWTASLEIVLGGLGLMAVFVKVERRKGLWRARWPTMLALLNDSWPLLFSGLAIMLYMRIDQVMLAGMAGERQVGLYSAALRFSEVWYVIPTVVVSSVMPALTVAKGQSAELYLERLQQLSTNLVRIALAVALPVSLASGYMMKLAYGEQYAAAGSILAVHVWAAVFVFLGVGAGPWILNEGLAKFTLCQTSLGALINIVLNMFLIPLYGALGCAIATLVSQGISAWISNSFFVRTRPIFRVQTRSLTFGLFYEGRNASVDFRGKP